MVSGHITHRYKTHSASSRIMYLNFCFLLQICDCWWRECCWLCSSSICGTRHGGWKALHCVERGEFSNLPGTWHVEDDEYENRWSGGNCFMLALQAHAPYERPALTKGYLFPKDKKPARLPVSKSTISCFTERYDLQSWDLWMILKVVEELSSKTQQM